MLVKNFILLMLALVAFTATSYGQASASSSGGTIILYKNSGDNEKSVNRGVYGSRHLLGEDIAEMFNDFEKAYVYYKQEGGAYGGRVKVIEKKPIYKAVHKVDKYIKKNVRKEKMSEAEGEKLMEMVLENAILLAEAETSKIEEDFSGLKKPEEILKYFERFEIVDGSEK